MFWSLNVPCSMTRIQNRKNGFPLDCPAMTEKGSNAFSLSLPRSAWELFGPLLRSLCGRRSVQWDSHAERGNDNIWHQNVAGATREDVPREDPGNEGREGTSYSFGYNPQVSSSINPAIRFLCAKALKYVRFASGKSDINILPTGHDVNSNLLFHSIPEETHAPKRSH